jgi:hypothetical protein
MESSLPPAPSPPDLWAQLPAIRRARDFRLYTVRGRRLVDLWQLGGAALLGHTPPRVLREFKNTAERGLFAPLPHHLAGRFHKALARLFPGKEFRVYPDELSLCRALEAAGYDSPAQDPAFPAEEATPSPAPRTVVLWRPFLGSDLSSPTAAPVQRPVLPLPWPGAPQVLVVEPSHAQDFPPSALVSPAILAAAARAIDDLLAAAQGGRARFPKITRALAQSPWRRRGIYLTPAAPPDPVAAAARFRAFLDQGFLLPPDPRLPLILPAGLSPGEEAALAALLRNPF